MALGGLLALLASSMVPTGAAQAAEKVSDYEQIRESTVRIVVTYRSGGRNRLRYGTGWLVESVDAENNAGLATVATAAHVVRGARRILIIEDGSTDGVNAEIKAMDNDRDVAFLEAKDLRGQALTMTQVRPKLGASLTTLGFTRASDREDEERAAAEASLKSGILSRELRGEKSLDLFEHSIELNPGYSGGPLLDECGRVVGIVVRSGGYLDLGEAGAISTSQDIGFAIAANEVIKVAGDENVEFTRDDSECGVKEAPVETPTDTPTGANSLDATDDTDSGSAFDGSGNGLIAGAIIALGLLIAAIAIFLLMRRSPSSVSQGEVEPAPAPAPAPVPSGSDSTTTSIVGGGAASKTSVASVSQINLTGTDPQGKPISIAFGSGDLAGSGALLGANRSTVAGFVDDQRGQRLVSREHAHLSFDGQNYQVTNQDATNGTFVGSRKLGPAETLPLKDGDTLTLADVALTVSIS